MFTGLVLSQLCVNLSLSEFQIGIVNAIPNVVLPFQVLSAFWVARSFPRKKLFMILGWISRLFILILAWLLVSDLNQETQVVLFMMFFLCFHISFTMGVPLWFSWASDLMTESIATRFFGDRNAIAFVSGMLYVLIFGLMLDQMDELNVALSWILGLTGTAACVELLFYHKISGSEASLGFKPQLNWLLIPFKDPAFIRFILFGIFYNGASFLVLPFFFIYFNDLGYSSLMIQAGMGLNAIGVASGSKLWSHLDAVLKRRGVLICTALLKTVMLLSLGFVDKTTPVYALALFFYFDGVAVGGWFTSSFSMISIETPKRNRIMMLALFFSITGLAAFVASFLSGVWMEMWDKQEQIEFIFKRTPFQALCWMGACCLPFGILCFRNYDRMKA